MGILRGRAVVVGAWFLVLLGASGPVPAAQVVQGSIAVLPTDNSAISGTVACRVWSISGADSGINTNTPPCQGRRCLRTYATAAPFGGGGYNCNQENTASYNADADQQTFYELIDAEAFTGTCQHIGFYAVQGQIAGSIVVNNPGDARTANCGSTTSQNCFTRADSTNADPSPLLFTTATYGPNPNQIASLGGFSPNPTVRVTRPGGGGCAANETRLTWTEPWLYPGTMKNGVSSPVQGVNLYVNNASCDSCPDGNIAAGWTLVGSFPQGAGATGVCQPIAGPSWFATTVRLKGPGSAPGTIETGVDPFAGFVGANSQCVGGPNVARIAGFQARYAGRRVVSVSWQSGNEDGLSYYVARAASPSGPFTRVSDAIATTGDGSRYTISDHVRGSFRMLYYRLEMVDSSGAATFSGTTAVVLPAPRAKK